MRLRTWLAYCLLFLALLAGALPALAQGNAPAHKPQNAAELRTQLLHQGWQEVAKDVLQHRRNGLIETYAFGRDGLHWVLQDLENQLGVLARAYRANPTDELRKTIETHEAEMARVNEELLTAPGEEGIGCNFSYGANADAYPLTGSDAPGVGAWGYSYFWNDCGYRTTVYAEADVYTTQSGSYGGQAYAAFQTGDNVSAYASLTRGGTSSCSSTGYSYVDLYSLFGYYLVARVDNSQCPVPDLSVYIDGPTSLFFFGSTCRLATWNAVASGGVPPYTYSWTVNGYWVGSGSSFSQYYCGEGYDYYYEDVIGVTVYDSAGHQASASVTVGIRSTGDTCNSIIRCPIEPY